MKGFTPKDGRELKIGQLVGVHWNSHKDVYSVVEFKSRKTVGKVLGYVDRITLEDCTVKIDVSKQKSVRDRGVKDRHAFIVGYVSQVDVLEKFQNRIYYSPKKVDSFVDFSEYQKGNVCYLEKMKTVNLDFDFTLHIPYVTYSKF